MGDLACHCLGWSSRTRPQRASKGPKPSWKLFVRKWIHAMRQGWGLTLKVFVGWSPKNWWCPHLNYTFLWVWCFEHSDIPILQTPAHYDSRIARVQRNTFYPLRYLSRQLGEMLDEARRMPPAARIPPKTMNSNILSDQKGHLLTVP